MGAEPLNILVTGASGFTGRYLLPLLRARGHQLVLIERPDEASVGGDIRLTGDLLDGAFLADAFAAHSPDLVIHLAAISFAAHGDLAEMYLTNILGTRHLLSAAAASGRRPRLLLASSGGVYRPDISRPLDEESPIAPGNDYLISKFATELLADQYRDRLSIRITRPFNYTGPGQAPVFLVPKIVAAIRHRDPVIRLGNIDVQRDFCDVRDVASAYAALATCPGETTVNICSGTTHSPREIIAMLEAETGHRIAVEVDPALVRASDPPRLAGCNARLRALLPGWAPRPLGETLRYMLEREEAPVS